MIFALSDQHGGIVAGADPEATAQRWPLTDGGDEVWSYLRRLRAQAWRAADVDPDVQWTRKQVIEHFRKESAMGVGEGVTEAETTSHTIAASTTTRATDMASSLGRGASSEETAPFQMFSPSGFNWADFEIEAFLNNENPFETNLEDIGGFSPS